MRPKDLPGALRLARIDGSATCSTHGKHYDAFHEFLKERENNRSFIEMAVNKVCSAINHMPPSVQSHVKRFALPAASALGLR